MKTAAATLVVAPAVAFAVDIPNTFKAGDPASASDVNENFSNLETAVDNLESSTSGADTTFGSDYYLDYATNGALGFRNVVVLKGTRTDNSGACTNVVYQVRVAFENTEDVNVSTPSGTETPPKIFGFGFVSAECANPDVNTFEQEFVYAVAGDDADSSPAGNFEDSTGVEVNHSNGNASFSNTNNFEYSLTGDRNSLTNAEMVHSVEAYLNGNGEVVKVNDYSHVISSFPRSVTVGGPLNETFSDIAMQNFSSYTSARGPGGRVRLLAKGVGPVQIFDNVTNYSPVFADNAAEKSVNLRAIYYRVDGTSNGSLANTPFASGKALYGEWFKQ